MTQRAARNLYRCLLLLHPEIFRNEFADVERQAIADRRLDPHA